MKTQKKQILKKLPFSVLFLILFMDCSKNSASCLNGSWIQEVSSDLELWNAASNAARLELSEISCAEK